MNLMNFPILVALISLIVLWLAALLGVRLRANRPAMHPDERSDFDVIVAAALTLLGLIIGFTFSMAISRYDQRKNYEEEEANAIGTEYLRANLLPPADAAKIQQALRSYLDLRIAFYDTRQGSALHQVNADTARVQSELWNMVETPVRANPTPVAALVAAGMNDVLNRQGYTQAAWWNRIPNAAWGLMAAIAICCNVLIGYGSRGGEAKTKLLLVLPIVVSISFSLIADIDSPRGGIVRVSAQNLTSLSESLHAS
jgi:hypothetical protein